MPEVSDAHQSAGEGTISRTAAWWGILLLPALLAFTVYWPYLDSYFVNDDWHLLRGVKDGNLLEVTARAFTFPPFTEFTNPTPFFRPLTDVAYKFLYECFGLRPEPYHVVVVLSHSLTAAALGILVARLARSPETGLAASVLFVTWPSYESGVVWISMFGEAFCAVLGSIALVAFHHYLVGDRSVQLRWLALAACCLLLASLSKQSATIFFVVLPLLAWATEKHGRTKRELVQAACAFGAVLAVAAGFWIYEQLYEAGAENVTQYEIGRLARYEAYLRHLVWPFVGSVALQRLLLATYLAAGLYFTIRGHRVQMFFFVWSLIALLPYAFVTGPEQPRYTYMTALPFGAFVAITGRDAVLLFTPRARPLARAGAAALVVLIAVLGARETRRAQVFIELQAQASARLVIAIRSQCAEMPPGSTMYVLGSGVLDPFGVNDRALVNMLFDNVYYRRVTEPQAVRPPDCFVDARPNRGG